MCVCVCVCACVSSSSSSKTENFVSNLSSQEFARRWSTLCYYAKTLMERLLKTTKNSSDKVDGNSTKMWIEYILNIYM
jgi:hypothetical protein